MTTTARTPRTQARTRRPPTRTVLLMLARRVHFLAGLAVAPFVFLLALTGLGYTVAPVADDLLHPATLFAREIGAHPLPLSEQVKSALARYPGARADAVTVSGDAERTTRITLVTAGASRSVYVDPYSGTVRAGPASPTQDWLAEAHRSLHLGPPGRLYAEFAVSWLPVIVLFGVCLRVSQRRRSGARAWHGALGLGLSAALLLIGFSGVHRTVLAGERMAGSLSTAPPPLTAPAVEPGTARIGLDEVVRLAHASGVDGTFTVVPPNRADRPFEVFESDSPSRVDHVAVDPYRAAVTASVRWDDYSAMAKARALATAFHHGTLFGWPNRAVLAGVALGTIALVALGYRMWWARRVVPPPVWRYVPARVRALLCAVIVAAGWLLPVLGVSVVLFAAVDTVGRRWAGRTRGRHVRR